MWFSKENHTRLTEVATLDRKSGEAERLQFRGPFLEMSFGGSDLSRLAMEA
jgi:hypothetical protein